MSLFKIRFYLIGMAALDPFIMTHNTGADIVNEMGKRPADILMQNEKKKSKAPSYIMENLAHFVALCEERVPFVSLCSELSEKNMSHQGVMVITLSNSLHSCIVKKIIFSLKKICETVRLVLKPVLFFIFFFSLFRPFISPFQP